MRQIECMQAKSSRELGIFVVSAQNTGSGWGPWWTLGPISAHSDIVLSAAIEKTHIVGCRNGRIALPEHFHFKRASAWSTTFIRHFASRARSVSEQFCWIDLRWWRDQRWRLAETRGVQSGKKMDPPSRYDNGPQTL